MLHPFRNNQPATNIKTATNSKPYSVTLRGLRFGQYGIRKDGIYYRCFYSHARLIDGRDCICIYAKDYTPGLPKELRPENGTDITTDYFETDCARIFAGTAEFDALLPLTEKHDKCLAIARGELVAL